MLTVLPMEEGWQGFSLQESRSAIAGAFLPGIPGTWNYLLYIHLQRRQLQSSNGLILQSSVATE